MVNKYANADEAYKSRIFCTLRQSDNHTYHAGGPPN